MHRPDCNSLKHDGDFSLKEIRTPQTENGLLSNSKWATEVKRGQYRGLSLLKIPKPWQSLMILGTTIPMWA